MRYLWFENVESGGMILLKNPNDNLVLDEKEMNKEELDIDRIYDEDYLLFKKYRYVRCATVEEDWEDLPLEYCFPKNDYSGDLENCWIDLNGDFYISGYMNHLKFASKILDKDYKYKNIDELIEKGWIRVSNPCLLGVKRELVAADFITFRRLPNSKQLSTLRNIGKYDDSLLEQIEIFKEVHQLN